MKGCYFLIALCCSALVVKGQVAQDSMPVAKPPVTDKDMLRTPVSPGDNMPIATPDGTRTSSDSIGRRSEIRKRTAPNKRKKRS